MIIQQNISLHDKNWFGTGGCAQYFAQPATVEDFQEALKFARERHLSIFMLGQGANILIDDNGFSGLVIRPMLNAINIDTTSACVTAGAGVVVHDLIDFCLDHELVGLEEFSGIPGSVGGSVYINIHYFEFLLSTFLVKATVINKITAEVLVVSNTWFDFGYNQSTLQGGDWFLVDATFQLKKVSKEEAAFAKGRRFEIIRHREKRYPSARTCGSFFRNFLDAEVPFLINEKKVLNVAYYLDKVGVRSGLRVGNAIVTHLHANMLVTLPNATSNDVVELAKKMQLLVYDHFGIIPQPECQLIGFREPVFV